jgi:hypothetical protein
MSLDWWSTPVILTLISIYYAYFHSVIKYWIILGGNSSNSGKMLILLKKVARIMVGAQPRTSCRSLFKQLMIPPVRCQYILTLMNFINTDQENFQTNSSIHNINTRNKHHLHSPNANPSCFRKNTIYAGIKIFNSLQPSLPNIKNDKAKLIEAIGEYLNTHTFYSVDEFFICENDIQYCCV